jgi:ABC-type dipeptide/oligopeptide/nickel transport system permease subunit
MRLTDIVYAFPALLFFIVMQISFGARGSARCSTGWCCCS